MQTFPVIGYFDGRGVVERVDGEQTIEVVYSEIKKIIDGVM